MNWNGEPERKKKTNSGNDMLQLYGGGLNEKSSNPNVNFLDKTS